MEMQQSLDNSDRPATHSSRTCLTSDGWIDAAQFLTFYENATMRFASGALNRLIHRHSSILPLRLIEGLTVGYTDMQDAHWAYAFQADLRTHWPDLVFESRASPESILLDVLSKCSGCAVDILELHNLRYTDKVMDVITQLLPSVTVAKVSVYGVASGHDQVSRLLQVVPGLRLASFVNDAAHPNAAAVLSVCAARKIPNVALRFAADVTEAEIFAFAFDNDGLRIARQFSIVSLRRSLSDNFFETLVEKCRRIGCKSLSLGVSGILTDPTNAKYSRHVVERNESDSMYKFEKEGPTNRALTVLVGKSQRFYLSVFLGDANDLCSSLDATIKMMDDICILSSSSNK